MRVLITKLAVWLVPGLGSLIGAFVLLGRDLTEALRDDQIDPQERKVLEHRFREIMKAAEATGVPVRPLLTRREKE